MKQYNIRVIEDDESVSVINLDRQDIKKCTLEELKGYFENLENCTDKPIAVTFAKSENMTIEQMVSEGIRVMF